MSGNSAERRVNPMDKRALQELWSDRTGAAAVVMAVTLPVFVGGLGMGAEVGYWYFGQRKVQNSADVAAYAGAVALRAGDDEHRHRGRPRHAAAVKTGYDAARGVIDCGVAAGVRSIRWRSRMPSRCRSRRTCRGCSPRCSPTATSKSPVERWRSSGPDSRPACWRSTKPPPAPSPSPARPARSSSAATSTPTRFRRPASSSAARPRSRLPASRPRAASRSPKG